MKRAEENSHQLLIQKLLVSIHYLTLFRDEIILVEKTPSLLGASFSPFLIQSDLADIVTAIDALEEQEKLLKATYWYEEESFKVMNHTLEIVDRWILGIDHLLDTCLSKSVFKAILGDSRPNVFGILADVFSSLRVVNMSLKEGADNPLIFSPLQFVDQKEVEAKKEELLAKIDALPLPPKNKKNEKQEEVPEFDDTLELLPGDKDDVVKMIRHFLFDRGNSQVYVLDAQEDLKKEINFYNAFDRFFGAADDINESIILLEQIQAIVERDAAKENAAQSSDSIYLILFGQNQLAEDSRIDSLLSELTAQADKADLQILSYQAYE